MVSEIPLYLYCEYREHFSRPNPKIIEVVGYINNVAEEMKSRELGKNVWAKGKSVVAQVFDEQDYALKLASPYGESDFFHLRLKLPILVARSFRERYRGESLLDLTISQLRPRLPKEAIDFLVLSQIR